MLNTSLESTTYTVSDQSIYVNYDRCTIEVLRGNPAHLYPEIVTMIKKYLKRGYSARGVILASYLNPAHH